MTSVPVAVSKRFRTSSDSAAPAGPRDGRIGSSRCYEGRPSKSYFLLLGEQSGKLLTSKDDPEVLRYLLNFLTQSRGTPRALRKYTRTLVMRGADS